MARMHQVIGLVVEDHANMRALWRTILLGFGIRKLVEAPDALSALDILRHEHVDVVFLDHILPDLSGAEVARLIRFCEDEALPRRIPIIACTADTRRATIRALINAGVDEVLAKPVSSVQAWKKLVSVVNSRRSFISSSIYFGPDRRRSQQAFTGPERCNSSRLDY